jgi:hypothetical protein
MNDKLYEKSLLVGTTGMLLTASQWVAERSQRCFVVSRHASDSSALTRLDSVRTLDLDWSRKDSFRTGLMEVNAVDRIDLAVLWVHQSGIEQLRWLIDRLSHSPCLVVRVLGSQASSEISAMHSQGEKHAVFGAARIINVVLGWKQEENGRRWLTWEEISDGVITAITEGESRIIGQVGS